MAWILGTNKVNVANDCKMDLSSYIFISVLRNLISLRLSSTLCNTIAGEWLKNLLGPPAATISVCSAAICSASISCYFLLFAAALLKPLALSCSHAWSIGFWLLDYPGRGLPRVHGIHHNLQDGPDPLHDPDPDPIDDPAAALPDATVQAWGRRHLKSRSFFVGTCGLTFSFFRSMQKLSCNLGRILGLFRLDPVARKTT